MKAAHPTNFRLHRRTRLLASRGAESATSVRRRCVIEKLPRPLRKLVSPIHRAFNDAFYRWRCDGGDRGSTRSRTWPAKPVLDSAATGATGRPRRQRDAPHVHVIEPDPGYAEASLNGSYRSEGTCTPLCAWLRRRDLPTRRIWPRILRIPCGRPSNRLRSAVGGRLLPRRRDLRHRPGEDEYRGRRVRSLASSHRERRHQRIGMIFVQFHLIDEPASTSASGFGPISARPIMKAGAIPSSGKRGLRVVPEHAWPPPGLRTWLHPAVSSFRRSECPCSEIAKKVKIAVDRPTESRLSHATEILPVRNTRA